MWACENRNASGLVFSADSWNRSQIQGVESSSGDAGDVIIKTETERRRSRIQAQGVWALP